MADCTHAERREGVCVACGDCFYCGTTDLDPIALSKKKIDPALVPADRLRKR
jgi:hypothetical protein